MHFAAAAGEVHAILGENGAGKSTFIGTLAGAVRADEGRILLRGAPYEPRSPIDAATAGIATVLQELSLIPDLTVAENIWFGRGPDPPADGGSAADQARTRALFADLELPAMDPGPRCEACRSQSGNSSRSPRRSRDAEVLILDETTSALVPARSSG